MNNLSDYTPESEPTSKKHEQNKSRSVAIGISKKFEDNVEKSEEIVERAKAATEAIDHLANNVKRSWMDCEKEITDAIKAARTKKFLVKTEMNSMLNQFKDVRKFFLADCHDEEVEKLERFVELCERLEKLKKSGFLDSVADTILKLS